MTGMSRREYAALALLACAAVAALTWFYAGTTAVRHLDSVFLFEALDGIRQTGAPVSTTVASWPEVARMLAQQWTPEHVCTMALGFPTVAGYNVLHNHAYLALYPMAVVSMLVGSEVALAFLNAAAHLSMLFLPYLFLRRHGLSWAAAAVFALCVACYPGWALSATGDYYLDRLYMPFMLALLYLQHLWAARAHQPFERRLAVGTIFFALAAASISERAAMMAMATLSFFFAVHPALWRRAGGWVLGVGLPAALAIYLAIYFRFFFQGFEGGGSLLANLVYGRDAILARLQQPGTVTFALTNALFIGWLALFAGWRYVLLLLGAMLPNIFVTLGGAELIGWSTHYHAMYIPFLVFAASVGFMNLAQSANVRWPKISVPLLAAASSLALAWTFNPFTAEWGNGLRADGRYGIVTAAYRFFARPERSAERAMAHWLGTLSQWVPERVRVSAIEGAMPALYRSRQLSLYPVGIDEAEYLVIAGAAVNGKPTQVLGAVSYLGQPALDRLNACLADRAAAAGFVFHKDVPPVGVLIFKREKKLVLR